MKSILSAQNECKNTVNSSEALIRSQSTLYENLLKSLEISQKQLDGMKKYSCSLQPLAEKLRTEKSYMDMLRDSESKYENALNELRNNYTELEEMWKTKYHELELSSQLRLDQYISESQSRYTTLLESSNKAYSDLREVYEAARFGSI